jgi:solute carrier family 25 (mitochondrial carnitine/acylcarnitine transporter), member 20/29
MISGRSEHPSPSTTAASISMHKTHSILLASTISGMCAGALGVVVGYPFDTMKTRIQASTSGVVKPVPYTIQGLKSLYRGVFMPLASTGCMQALNFAVYGSVKHALLDHVDEGSMTYLQSVFVAGAASGGVMSVLATPIQVVKVQYQTDMSMTLQKLRYSLYSGTKLPIVALYRGYWVTATGDVLGRGMYMYSYEAMKLLLSSQRHDATTVMDVSMTHKMLAAGFAGSFTWFALFPIDVIKTRVQSAINGSSGRQHMKQILSSSNALSQLYRGCFYAVIRAAPVAASILPVYEYLNEELLTRL